MHKQINQKTAKNSWLSIYKRLRSNKINYMFVFPKKYTKKLSTKWKIIPKKKLEKEINQMK